jgi:hypothetical protein
MDDTTVGVTLTAFAFCPQECVAIHVAIHVAIRNVAVYARPGPHLLLMGLFNECTGQAGTKDG